MPFVAEYQKIVKSNNMMTVPSINNLLDTFDANKEPRKFFDLRKAALAGMEKYNDDLAKKIADEQDKTTKANLTRFKTDFVRMMDQLKNKIPPAPPLPPGKKALPKPSTESAPPKKPLPVPPTKEPVKQPVVKIVPAKPSQFLNEYQKLVKANGQSVAPSVSMSLNKIDANKDGSKTATLCQAAAAAMTKYNDTLTTQLKAEKDANKKVKLSKFGTDFRKLLQAVKEHAK